MEISRRLAWGESTGAIPTQMDSPFSSSSPLSTPSSRPPRPKVTALSFLGLLPALLGAVIVGIIYHFVARFFDLLILFPLVAGGLTGAVLAALARKNKVRSVGAMVFMGILCGLVCYGTREFSDSLKVREQVIAEGSAEIAGKNPKLRPVVESSMRQELTPVAFFPMYLEAAAQEGFSISRHPGSSSGAPVSGWGFWAIFIFDALLICGAATAVAAGQASSAFCEACDDWYTDDMVISSLHPNQGEEALRLLQSGDYAGMGNLRGEGADDKMHTDLLLSKCKGCGVGHLKLVATHDKNKNTLWEGDPTPQEIKTLEQTRAQAI
jgi:hypothetical protein